jgi:2EXR family
MYTQRQKPHENSPPNTIMADPTFHLFPKLPTELRFNIWELAFSGPRTIIPIFPYGESEDLNSRPQNPSTLYVNKESRDITLKYYTKIDTPPHGSQYVNFAVDCLRIHFDIFYCRPLEVEPEGPFWLRLDWPADPYQVGVAQFHLLKKAFANTRSLEIHLSHKSFAWARDFSKFLYEWLPSIFPRVENVTLTYPCR